MRNPAPILRKFGTPRSLNLDTDIWREVISETDSYFDNYFWNTRPYHFNDRLDDIKKPTSPGSYWKKKGFKTKKDVLEDDKARNCLRYRAHLIKTGESRRPVYPCTVTVADAKESVEGVKARVVWSYPLEVISIENMFYAALNDHLPDDWVPTPEVYHHRFCQRNSGSGDFSNFDSSIHSDLIRLAFSYFKSKFDFEYYQGGAKVYSKHSLERLWAFVVDYFINTPFILPGDDTIRRKHHGVPSGSMFTNLIDTYISRLVVTYIHRVGGCGAAVTTYGDDSHWRDCQCSPSELESRASDCFSMKMKVEEPNEHGCLTYCKAECHLGEPFHSGLWFRNILNCCPKKYVREVCNCLQFMSPTIEQYNELEKEKRKHPKCHVHRTMRMWIEKVKEYWPKFRNRISDVWSA